MLKIRRKVGKTRWKTVKNRLKTEGNVEKQRSQPWEKFSWVGKNVEKSVFPQVGEKSLGKPLPCNMENGKSRRKLVRVKVEIHRVLIGRMFVEIVIVSR